MKTKRWAIALMIVCTLFTSSAQILYKMGTNHLSFNFISIVTNWQIIAGLFLYAIGAALVILAFRGGEVTVLYPIVTSSYIWVTLASTYYFGEVVNLLRWSGIVFIILGIFIITFGSKDKGAIKYTDPV